MALMRAVAQAPKATPSLHGLLSVAEITTDADGGDRWRGGVTWDPETCAWVRTRTLDCDPYTFDPEDIDDLPACVEADPFGLWVEYDRLAVPADLDPQGIVQRQLEAVTGNGIERELWTGALNPLSPHLAWSTEVTVLNSSSTPVTGMSPNRALAALEDALSSLTPSGGPGVIHAQPDVVSLWTQGGGAIRPVTERGVERLQTVAKGNRVAAGGGYPNTGPDGVAPSGQAGFNLRWVYATGPVRVWLGDIETIPSNNGQSAFAQAFDRKTNRYRWRAQREAMVAFDRCAGPFAVLVNLGD